MNSNFGKNIKDMSEEELLQVINEFNVNHGQIAMGELTRRSMGELKKAMDEFNNSTALYSKILIYFTALLLIVAFLQVLVAVFPPQDMFIKWFYLLATLICVGTGLWFTSKALDQ
jgi:hypothetical protein